MIFAAPEQIAERYAAWKDLRGLTDAELADFAAFAWARAAPVDGGRLINLYRDWGTHGPAPVPVVEAPTIFALSDEWMAQREHGG